MTYRGHLVGGAAAAALSTRVLPPSWAPTALVLAVLSALVGSLAPDLDARGSYLSRALGPLYWVGRLCLSNPATWALAGLRIPAARVGPRPVPLALRLFVNPLTRALVGERACWRFVAGRARVGFLLEHRHLSHSLTGLAGATFAWPALLVGLAAGLRAAGVAPAPAGGSDAVALLAAGTVGFALGYGSHLLLDAMTISGVPLLMPWDNRRFWVLPRLLRWRTGG